MTDLSVGLVAQGRRRPRHFGSLLQPLPLHFVNNGAIFVHLKYLLRLDEVFLVVLQAL